MIRTANWRAAAIALQSCGLERLGKDAPVGQAGQRVVPGHRLRELLGGLGRLMRLFKRGQVLAVGLLLLLGGPRLGLLEAGDVGVGADDPRDAAVGHSIRPACRGSRSRCSARRDAARDTRMNSGSIRPHSVDRPSIRRCAIVGMNARKPGLTRRIDRLVEPDAAHLPPHAARKRPCRPSDHGPRRPARRLEGEVPAALALGKRGLDAPCVR